MKITITVNDDKTGFDILKDGEKIYGTSGAAPLDLPIEVEVNQPPIEDDTPVKKDSPAPKGKAASSSSKG